MGCFNMICAVTGLEITAGDPIAGFNLSKNRYENYGFNQAWYVDSWVHFGHYDDYGRLELSDGSTPLEAGECDPMFMHRHAYNMVIEAVEKEVERDAKMCLKHGYTDWSEKFKKDLLSDAQKYFEEKENTFKHIYELKFKSEFTRLIGDHGCDIDNWYEMLDSETYKHVIDAMLDAPFKIMSAAHLFQFRLMPSMYGSQEFDTKHFKMLNKSRNVIIKQIQDKWGD